MSVLDQMTRHASERKADASAQLTPVGIEVAPPGAFVTTPAEERRSWLAAVTEAREHTQRALAVLTAAERNLNRGLGHTMEADYFAIAEQVFGDDLIPTSRQTKAELVGVDLSDEEDAFAADYAAKSAAAQAATYQTGDLGAALTSLAPSWACPDHGTTALTTRKGRTRTFRACTECGQYEGKVTT